MLIQEYVFLQLSHLMFFMPFKKVLIYFTSIAKTQAPLGQDTHAFLNKYYHDNYQAKHHNRDLPA